MTDLGPQRARIGLGPSDGSSDKTKKAHMGRSNFSQGDIESWCDRVLQEREPCPWRNAESMSLARRGS